MRGFGKRRQQQVRKPAARRKVSLALEALEERNLLTTWFVSAFNGNDAFGNGSTLAPFQSLQKAINTASSGDEIHVAIGTYGYTPSQDQLASSLGSTAVGVVFNKFLTIRGGYNPFVPNGWTAPQAGARSVIDGGTVVRGLWVTGTAPGASALTLDGFVVTNGVGSPIPLRGGANQYLGFGGGLLDEGSFLSLNNTTFQSNRAFGLPAPNGGGGDGAGGGVALLGAAGTVMMNNVSFVGNSATGSNGSVVGGFGHGGGMFLNQTNLTATNLTLTGNLAQGGSTTGAGFGANAAGVTTTGDGLGGGISTEGIPSLVSLSDVTATGNQALGGNAPAGQAGSGGGGAVFDEELPGATGAVSVTDSTFQSNTARGGSGITGSPTAFGGALYFANVPSVGLDRVFVLGNTAQGGNSTGANPSAIGGGVAAIHFNTTAPYSFSANNTVIAGNAALFGAGGGQTAGGGGAGLGLTGYTGSVTQSTIADNAFPNAQQSLQGDGILVYTGGQAPSASLTLANSIVANNHDTESPSGGALAVIGNNSVALQTVLFANNTLDIFPGSNVSGQNTILSASSAGFLSPGAPNFDYGLAANSAAIDRSVGSTATVDAHNAPRVGVPDLGALERANPLPGDTIGGYDPGTATWYLRTSLNGGVPQIQPFAYGLPGWRGIVGDWNGDGVATIGVFNPAANTFLLSNVNGPSFPFAIITITGPGGAPLKDAYGLPLTTAIPVAGDWDNNGTVTVGLFDPTSATWYLRNSNTSGPADVVFAYGLPGWTPVVGKWNGTTTGIGVVAPASPSNPADSEWFLRNTATGGLADSDFLFGPAGAKPLTGDWDGNGSTGIGFFYPPFSSWALSNTAGPSFPDTSFVWGAGSWDVFGGEWVPSGTPEFADLGPASGTTASSASPLSAADLNAVVTAALAKLRDAGVSDPALQGTSFQIAALPGGLLGLTSGHTVTIDATAQGLGWYTGTDGKTPGNEFDLETVVLHELGNVMGVPETHGAGTDTDISVDVLAPGVSRTVALDQAFGLGF